MIYYLLLMVLYLYKKKGTASGLYFHSFFYTISYIVVRVDLNITGPG